MDRETGGLHSIVSQTAGHDWRLNMHTESQHAGSGLQGDIKECVTHCFVSGCLSQEDDNGFIFIRHLLCIRQFMYLGTLSPVNLTVILSTKQNKTRHNLKLRIMVYSVTSLRTVPWTGLSSEELFQRGRLEPRYTGIFVRKKKCSRTAKKDYC